MHTPLCQIALSVSDLARSRSWYEQLGLKPSGAMPPISGDVPARILELPEVDIRINWLRGHDPMSQLEIMHFLRPAPRPLAPDWSPRDKGYGIVSLAVADFEGMLNRVRAAGASRAVTGQPGSRSLWIADPDGIPLEILEKDPLGRHRANGSDAELTSIRAITLTVEDLPRAYRFWSAAVGLMPCSASQAAFNPLPERLDPAAGAWEQQLLQGGTLILRLLKPRTCAIVPRRPDFRLSDVGVLNVAAIVDSPEAFSDLLERVRKLGYRFTTEVPMTMGDAAAIYGHDDQGISIEMGYVLPGHEGKYGWNR